MSATNRGADRIENDVYQTPPWCVRRLLETVKLPRGAWLEPCADTGAIIKVARELDAFETMGAIEIRRTEHDLARVADWYSCGTDYLTWHLAEQGKPRQDVIITNPPFSLAEPIIKKALTEADWVAMLLRMNFLGSDGRANWLRNEMPDIYTLPDRPSFIVSYKCKPRDAHDRGCGWTAKVPALNDPGFKVCPACGRKVQRASSDSAEYGWMVWTPERGRTVGRTCILASTPEEERRAA